jgi:class 3 adenylate cyclase
MPIFAPDDTDYVPKRIDGHQGKLLSKSAYDAFGLSLLGLGDITKPSKPVDAIAAVFDLEGFTNFCKQIEPHLSVPLFLSEFLSWLLDDIKKEMTKRTYKEGAHLWCPLPFLVKFLGDGLLVLWDVGASSDDVQRRNVVVSARAICDHYHSQFLPRIYGKVVEPPTALRCGLARGTVYSVGDGNDYVGSCINMAARLQKIPGSTFAFNRRGFDLEDSITVEFFKTQIVVKQMAVRGIRDNELIALLKDEYAAMSPRDKKQFRDL